MPEHVGPSFLVVLEGFGSVREAAVDERQARAAGEGLQADLDRVAKIRELRVEPGLYDAPGRVDDLVLPLDPGRLSLRAQELQAVFAARAQVDVRAGQHSFRAPPFHQLYGIS